MLFTVIVLSCSSHDFENAGGSSTTIGPAGGKLETPDGVVVDVPAGALEQPVTITVEEDDSPPSSFRIDGRTYRFLPYGLHFAKDVVVTFPSGVFGEGVFWTQEGARDRFELVSVDVVAGKATANVRHFSSGFVGASSGITCTVRRGDLATCTTVTSVENDVPARLVRASSSIDPESGIHVDSEGMNLLYDTIDGDPRTS